MHEDMIGGRQAEGVVSPLFVTRPRTIRHHQQQKIKLHSSSLILQILLQEKSPKELSFSTMMFIHSSANCYIIVMAAKRPNDA